jgi:hypothetical protein
MSTPACWTSRLPSAAARNANRKTRWAWAPRGVAPEEQLLASETKVIIALPLAQREVITLRDIEGSLRHRAAR